MNARTLAGLAALFLSAGAAGLTLGARVAQWAANHYDQRIATP